MAIPKAIPCICAAVLLLPNLSGGSAAPSRLSVQDSAWHAVRPAMGTTAEIWVYAASSGRASELMEAAFAEIERVEAGLSTYRGTSEASRINARAYEEAVVTDPETFAFLERALDLSERTGGAFDITVGGLVKAWGFFGGAGHYPSSSVLAETRAGTGWKHVILDRSARSVRFLVPGIELDPGGIGKGWALDRAARTLRRLGVESALLGLGQSSYYAIGAPPGSPGWIVAVPDPRSPDRTLSSVYLRDQALSTSASTERYFELDGERYSHIIDPRTGHPARGTVQVTVLAPAAADSDALSTAMFVLGPAGSRALVDGASGVAALFVTEQQRDGGIVAMEWPAPIVH